MQEVYNGWIKFNLMMEIEGYRYATSITLKKNIVALWLVMMDKIHCDHNRVIIDFIQNVCMKRWKGNSAKGMSDFVAKCMIHSMLDKEDYESFKMIYLSLNGRQNNHLKIKNPERGNNFVLIKKNPSEEKVINSVNPVLDPENKSTLDSENPDPENNFLRPTSSKKSLARKVKKTYIRKK